MSVIRGRAIENSALVLLARVVGSDGAPIVQADIDTIELRSYVDTGTDKGTLIVPDGEDEMTYTGTSLLPANVIFDTLQTGDVRWTSDDDGFNFAVTLDGSYIPEAGETYQVETKITPVSGPAIYVLWSLKVTNIWSE